MADNEELDVEELDEQDEQDESGSQKQKTALGSIRKYCLWCSGGSRLEVRLCPVTDCALFPFRASYQGKKPSSSVKAIRARCLQCAESVYEVKDCPMGDCELYLYRFGKNPFRPKPNISEERRNELRERFEMVRKKKACNQEEAVC